MTDTGTHILTLIGPPGEDVVDAGLVVRAARLLPQAGAPVWLAPGEACDVAFRPTADIDPRAVAAAVRAAAAPAPVDIAVQPLAHRRKMLLVADMDSTIIEQECIDEIADFAGIKAQVAGITERAMRGEIAFEGALKERVALLRGLDAAVLERVHDERLTLTPGACALVRTMRAHGAMCVLVSGGFTFFTRRIAERVGFDQDQANRLEISAGRLTGRVGKPILGREAKLEALRRLRASLGLARTQTMAVGDGANDLAMIREAGLGVAFRAKPAVAAEAAVRVDHGDLTALLYLQGYSRDEFRA